jgi:hypothetical protein
VQKRFTKSKEELKQIAIEELAVIPQEATSSQLFDTK